MLLREKEIEVLKRIEDNELKNFKEKSLYEKIDHLTFEIPWLIARHYHHGDVHVNNITPKVRRRVSKKLKHNPFHYMGIFKEPFVKDIITCDREDLFDEIMRQNMILMIKDLWETKVGRGEYYKLPEKKAPYYVYAMQSTFADHPAEGGSVNSYHDVAWVREFQTFKKALKFIRKELKETDFEIDKTMLMGYGRVSTHSYVSNDKQHFGVYSGWMSDRYDVHLERKPPYSWGTDWDGRRTY